MALFKKKKSKNTQGRPHAKSQGQSGRRNHSQDVSSRLFDRSESRRSASISHDSQKLPPKETRQRNSDQRNVRAGSQRRAPLERITPSRGHKPSQHNTSIRRPDQAAPADRSRNKMSNLRQQRMQQEAYRAQQESRSQRMNQPNQYRDDDEYTLHSVDELRQVDRQNKRANRADKTKQARRKVKRYIIIAVIVLVLGVGGVFGGIAVYNSSLFSIQNVKVTGVEHLTASEMTQLANVPADTTLLRVDTATIADRVKASAWVEDVQVKRIFPDTLELVVTEREMAAVVEIPVKSISGTKQWAIAKDTMWLMPIPEAGSEGAKTTSAKIYEDAENAIRIKDLPFGTVAEIGKLCTDSTVNNVMAILSGMTTELADMVVEVSASGIAETTLILNNGVEVAFGEAKDIRDKERVVLEILERNPEGVSYINVRMVETPTWRAI